MKYFYFFIGIMKLRNEQSPSCGYIYTEAHQTSLYSLAFTPSSFAILRFKSIRCRGDVSVGVRD